MMQTRRSKERAGGGGSRLTVSAMARPSKVRAIEAATTAPYRDASRKIPSNPALATISQNTTQPIASATNDLAKPHHPVVAQLHFAGLRGFVFAAASPMFSPIRRRMASTVFLGRRNQPWMSLREIVSVHHSLELDASVERKEPGLGDRWNLRRVRHVEEN